jgi:hypothetical protein
MYKSMLNKLMIRNSLNKQDISTFKPQTNPGFENIGSRIGLGENINGYVNRLKDKGDEKIRVRTQAI